jgi:hypothetical protein
MPRRFLELQLLVLVLVPVVRQIPLRLHHWRLHQVVALRLGNNILLLVLAVPLLERFTWHNSLEKLSLKKANTVLTVPVLHQQAFQALGLAVGHPRPTQPHLGHPHLPQPHLDMLC